MPSLKYNDTTAIDVTATSPADLIVCTKAAIPGKRAVDHRAKWRWGDRNADDENAAPRPWRRRSPEPRRDTGKYCWKRGVADRAFATRHPLAAMDPGNGFQGGVPTCSGAAAQFEDTSGDHFMTKVNEGICEHWEAQVMYSYDEPAGPVDGRDVLGLALECALEKLEDETTGKLVRDEYDLVSSCDEEDAVRTREVEEEFEMLY